MGGISNLFAFAPIQSEYDIPTGLVPTNNGVQDFSTGDNFSLLADGSHLYSWGYQGVFRRLGVDLPGTHRAERPIHVPIPGNPQIVQCSAGGNHSLALDVEGNVYSFGGDYDNQLGQTNESFFPVLVALPDRAIGVFAGFNFSVALIRSQDAIYTWGSGQAGQLGHGCLPPTAPPTRVELGGTVHSMSVGHSHVAAILDSPQRHVVTWGGDGISVTRPHIIKNVPRLPAQDVVQVAAGYQFTLLRTHDGLVFSAGTSDKGQLGLDDRFGRNHACIVGGLLRHFIVYISASYSSATALSVEGDLFFWGSGFDIPLKFSTNGFPMLLRYPFSQYVRMDGASDVILIEGINGRRVNKCASGCRRLRAFVKSFNDGEFLPMLCQTRVLFKGDAPNLSADNISNSVLAYGPLLAASSEIIARLLNETQGRLLDISKHSKAAVTSFIKLVSCGVIDEDVSTATVQEVSEILDHHKVSRFDRIALEFLRRRLLSMHRDDLGELWDALDGELEKVDERRMRKHLAAIKPLRNVRVRISGENGTSTCIGEYDLLLMSAQSLKFRTWISSRITGNEINHTDFDWEVQLSGLPLWIESVIILQSWLKGEVFALIQNGEERDAEYNIRLCVDVMRLACCFDIPGLKAAVEEQFMTMVDETMKLSTWEWLLAITKTLGYTRGLHKLLRLGDNLCTRIHIKRETKRVEQLERVAQRKKQSKHIATARCARRDLLKFRRSKVFCDWAMDRDDAVQNLRNACMLDKRLKKGQDGRLDGA